MARKPLKLRSVKLPYAGIVILVAMMVYIMAFPVATVPALVVQLGIFYAIAFVVMKLCRSHIHYYHRVDRQLLIMETYLPMLFSMVPLAGPFFVLANIYKLMRGKIGGYLYREGGTIGSNKFVSKVNLKKHGVPAAIVLILVGAIQPLALVLLPDPLAASLIKAVLGN